MYLEVMVGEFAKRVVREWCLAVGQEVLYKQYHHFCPCQEQEGPQGWGACSTFPQGPQQGLLF